MAVDNPADVETINEAGLSPQALQELRPIANL